QPHDDVRQYPTVGIPHQAAAFRRGVARTRGPRWRPIDQMNVREMGLMMRVMTNRTRPISMSACRCRSSVASANSFAMTADIVYCGAKSDQLICGLLPMTIVTAIVSPAA